MSVCFLLLFKYSTVFADQLFFNSDVWLRINPDRANTENLRSILCACIKPRRNSPDYKDALLDLFAYLCFLEGSYGSKNCLTPYINSEGTQIASNSKSSEIAGLSNEAMEFLNGKSLSMMIAPTEELFFCLTIAKFVAAKLQDVGADMDEFKLQKHEKKSELVITPFRKSLNACYGSNDLKFFEDNIKIFLSSYDDDIKKVGKAVANRCMVFDFSAELAAPVEESNDPANPSGDTDEDRSGNGAAMEEEVAAEEDYVFDWKPGC